MIGLRRDESFNVDLEFMNEVDAALRDKGRRWPYYFGIGCVAAFVLFLLWAGLTMRPELTRGEGQLTPSLGVQPIQSPESGIVVELFVKDGSVVKKDQVLAILSDVEAMAGFNELNRKKVWYELALRRLRSELAGTKPVYTQAEQKDYPDLVEEQSTLYESRTAKLAGDERELTAMLAVRSLELEEAQEKRKLFEQSLTILQEQESKVRPLVRQRIYPQVSYLSLQQRIAAQTQDLASLAQTISRLHSAIEETQARLDTLRPERESAINTEIQNFSSEMSSLSERMTSGEYKVQSRRLTAPMDGTIKRVLLKEQSVARQADLIMELLPAHDTLEVNAKFRPADRSRLQVGRNATIKVSAFDFTQYGTLDAEVVSISPDTIEDSKGQSWYHVRLRTRTATLPYADKNLQLESGMTVTVEVHSGEKSILTYLLKPLFKSRQGVTSVGGHTVEPEAEPTEAPRAQGEKAS